MGIAFVCCHSRLLASLLWDVLAGDKEGDWGELQSAGHIGHGQFYWVFDRNIMSSASRLTVPGAQACHQSNDVSPARIGYDRLGV